MAAASAEKNGVNINFNRRNLTSAQESHPFPDVCYSFLILFYLGNTEIYDSP